MRFFLLDRVTKLETNSTIEGIKAWSLDNEIFLDHFPGSPIVPGILLTESMAQLLGLLIEYSYYEQYPKTVKAYPVLSIIQKAKFRNIVEPGDQCKLKGTLLSLDQNRAVGKVQVFVDEELKAESTLSFSIGTTENVKVNPFFNRRQEYIQILLKNMHHVVIR